MAAEAGECLLPPMILQPLVENAVKYGIGNLTEGGAVRIAAARAGSLLRLSVENDVDPDQPAAPGNGIGLANVRQRLRRHMAPRPRSTGRGTAICSGWS